MENQLNKETAFDLMKKKAQLQFSNEQYGKEIDILAHCFEEKKEEFIELGKDVKYYNVIALVLKSNDFRISKEDDLLDFIFKLCEIDRKYECLFEYLWFDYCSLNAVQNFINYVNKNICINENIQAIVSSMSRRLLRKSMPLLPYNIRYNYQLVDRSDPVSGIFSKEYQNDNIIAIEYRNSYKGKVFDRYKYNIFSNISEGTSFRKSFVISLKNNKLFSIAQYMIRGNSGGVSNDQLQSWDLYGKNANTGYWIKLDSHSKECFGTLQTKVFNINYTEPLSEIKLEQTGASSSGSEATFSISAFDIFGWIFP